MKLRSVAVSGGSVVLNEYSVVFSGLAVNPELDAKRFDLPPRGPGDRRSELGFSRRDVSAY